MGFNEVKSLSDFGILVKNGCPSGYAFVRDFYGNKMFYGTIKECKEFMYHMEKEICSYLKCNLSSIYGRSVQND